MQLANPTILFTESETVFTAPKNAISEAEQDAANEIGWQYHFGPVLEAGVYEKNGVVYVVKPNQERTRLHAKRWVVEGSNHHLEYDRGAVYNLHPIDKVTRERGEQLSVGFGACCVCGRILTDPNSVGKGIGPVCGKLFA